ncbi:MAG: ATP-binding protein, partial [Hyphomicrobiaceae bacterium]
MDTGWSRRAIATPEEERRLVEKRRWGNLPFDAQPVMGSQLADLDLTRFTLEYAPALVSTDTIAQNTRTVEQQLRALRLINESNVPTTTAILMLGKSPQDWFPAAMITWRRIDGTTLTDPTADERTLTGTIPDQLRRIDELMDAAIPAPIEMGRDVHTRQLGYPLAALQQLVRNAVMHRSYEATNSPVRVTWYADRVEFLNPGGPFGAVTPDIFGQPGYTDYRNPTLAEALKGYGFVERFGQGFEIVRRTLEANGNPPVVFQLQPGWV